MADYNHWTGMGHLTRKPETKTIPNSSLTLTEVSVAINKSWKDKATDEWKEKVSFIDCQQWGDRGEAIATRCDKGMQVLIEGDLEQQRWEDKETGANRSKQVINIKKLLIIGDKTVARTVEEPPPERRKAAPQKDDDVPF